jgi:hypothetical protein
MHRLRDLRLLGQRERRLLTWTATPLASRERLVPAKALSANPLAHRLARNIKQPRHLGLRTALVDQSNSTPTKLLLSRLPQPPGIPSPHTPKPTNRVGRLLARSSMYDLDQILDRHDSTKDLDSIEREQWCIDHPNLAEALVTAANKRRPDSHADWQGAFEPVRQLGR